ncbi:DUF2306 domain-containing protein [Algibacter agarivorans]
MVFLIALFYISRDLEHYGMKEETLGRFWNVKWWLICHLTTAIVAVILGPLQFWKWFRNRNIKLHRQLGKIYILSIIITSLCSSYLAWNTAIKIHFTWALTLQVAAVIWIITVLMAYRTAKLKRIQQHKEWMIRSYIVTMVFISFRFFNDYFEAAQIGTFIERAATIGYLATFLPLFLSELVFQWNRKK